MTQVAQRNNHVLQMLKRLKETLENDKKKYADKVNVLVMTWERIAASAREQRPLAAICIVEKMYKDTLNIMLQGEWPKMSPVSKTHLMQMLNRCRVDLCKEMPWLNHKFKKLLELVNDPWTLPSLERIMHQDPSPATPEQIVEFCESERGLLIVTRLTMLCSSRCEKVAIKLAGACYHALANGKPSLLSLFTRNEYFFIFDIYLCLLYKYKKLESIINALKPVSVTDGHTLVIRLQRRHILHEQKIWKFSVPVATIAARYFVTVAMLSRTIPNTTLLKKLIKNWLTLNNASENNMENEIRKIIQPAETSEHIYLMAETLATMSQQLGNQMYRSLIMELYIRALTGDINYLERMKLQNDREQISAYEKHLAAKFLDMADLVKDHAGVRREFILTAFSIHPSAEIYRRVEEEAVASGKASPHSTPTSQESMEVGVLSEGLSSLSSEEPDVKEAAVDYSVNNDSQDSGAFVQISNRCSLHLPYDGIGPEGELCFQCGGFTGVQTPRSISNQQKAKKERSLDALILIKGNTVTESLNYDVLSAPSQVLEAEKLGLSSQVCADLVTLLGSNRYHLLTWVLEWGELSSRCLRYMDEADTIKSGKKELKFLEIDYNQYKDWPENEEEVDCIEKGYEQWLEDDNTETDFDTDSKRSNTDDSEEMSMLKTAIRRSQKQMGRYAESSSDSDDSRARNKRKRGRARKRNKYMSDSGSVSDSLGSDGQKQKLSAKRPRKQTKDLRKKLCTLRVLDMEGENDTLSSSNEKISNEVLDNSMYSLPTALAVKSDPSVLKSLRAFRLNAHKQRQNELVHAVTKKCQNSKSYSGQVFSVPRNSVFDCNDNKFITKDDSLSVGNNNIEIHFKNSGVKAKNYNDIIRTIKEDLISVSNIPCVANNATIQVVHLQDSANVQDLGASRTTEVFSSESQPASAPSTSVTPEVDFISTQKLKPVNESHGSHIRKTTSSQSTNQTTETSVSLLSGTTAKTYLSSALSRTAPAARVVGGSFNNLVTVVSRPDSNRIVTQQNCRTVVNKNSVNQNRTGANDSANNRNALNVQLGPSSASAVNNCSKNLFQNSVVQVGRTAVPSARASAPLASETTKIFHENERQYSLTGRTCSIQNFKATAPPFNTYIARHITPTGQNSTQTKKTKDSSGNTNRSGAISLDSVKTNEAGTYTTENCLMSKPVGDLPCAANSEKTTTAVKVHITSSEKTTTAVKVYTTSSEKIITPVKVHTTSSEKTSTPVTVHTTSPEKSTAPVTVHTTSSEKTTTPVKVHTTSPEKTTAPVKVHTTSPEKTTAPVTVNTTSPEKTTAPVTVHTTSPEKTTAPVTVHTTSSEKTTTPVKVHTTSPEKTTAPVKVHTTSPEKTTAPVKVNTTSPEKTTAPVKVNTTSSEKTSTAVKVQATSPEKTTTAVKVQATSPEKTTTAVKVQATSPEKTTAPLKVHTTSSEKITEQPLPTNVIVNPAPSTTKVLPVKYMTEQDLQSVNASYLPQNGSDNVIKSSTDVNTVATCTSLRPSTIKPAHKLVHDRAELQTNLNSHNRHYISSQANGAKRNIQASSSTANTSQGLVIPDGGTILSRSDGKCHSSTSAENCNSGQTKSTTTVTGVSLDRGTSSSVPSTMTNTPSRTFANTATIYGNKIACSEATNTTQDVKVTDVNSTLTPPAVGNVSACNSLSSVKASTGGENSSAELPSTKILPNRNILATVLKRNSANKVQRQICTPRMSIYTPFSTRSSDAEPIANVLVTQSATSSTIHYTAINPNSSLQNAAGDGLNSVGGDMIERVVKQEEFATPRSVMSPSSSQIKSSTSEGGNSVTVAEESQASKHSCGEDNNCASQQKTVVPSKKIKTNSSQSIGQTETGFTKKQVFNNQKITILVQNNGDNKEDLENQQKNKLGELLLRDDQKTCITFRAIKRTQASVGVNEIPPAKKPSQSRTLNKNGQTEVKEIKSEPGTCDKGDTNPAGTVCQYLVLEAINDPSGALPKFNQAFGKSYQIKLPQPIKMEPVDLNENGENDGSGQIMVELKSESKPGMDSEVIPSPITNQVPVASSVRGNVVGGAHKPVKNVYIDKEIKTEVQSPLKTSYDTVDAPASIPAIHMTEIQQPNVNTFQSVSKVARSTVVQQFIRKVPAAGPTTLQAVNSFNAMNVRQVKTQDIVSAPTLIYATAARAQSQILIQRAVGRVNAPTISQVAPVFYTQQPSDQPAPPTQTLLLAAVPTGTRGVVPSTQLVRLPPNSGIWRMAPTVNPSRIVQFRPQNLVIQGNQDQGVLMHSTQPVLLHHVTSLPVKPISLLTNPVKSEDTIKIDMKNDIYIKTEGNRDNAKMCSMEAQQTPSKTGSSSPVATTSEHETVALMQDIKEFENVFEETKLKFEMEEQQSVCLPEVESVSETKPQTLPAVDASQETQIIPSHQTVLVQPQLMLHKPHMIITSATPNQTAVFRQKVDKEFALEKDSQERILLKQKPKKHLQTGVEEASQTSHVTLAYVTRPTSTATIQKPLVVVTNYGQPPASPAPSITSQSSSSPNSIVSGTSLSTTAGTAKASTKAKTRSTKAATNPNKSPPASKPQQKPQEDASTAQKIYAILEEYAVQLRNSPDMNNRPAPRRRSNPPAGSNSKRKRNVCKRESLSDGDDGHCTEDVKEPVHSSEDSSSGVAVVQKNR